VNLYGCDADRTILFGISMGSVIAFSSAERVRCCCSLYSPPIMLICFISSSSQTLSSAIPPHLQYPNVYDGVIAGCSAGAGTTALFDSSLIVNMVYDAAFMDAAGNGSSQPPP
jgi:hypothetical protein